MIKILIFISLLFSTLFSNNLDVSNLKNLKSLEYISFIDDEKNVYSYEDINNKTDLKPLKIMHIGSANGPFWTKLSLVNNSNETKSITLYNSLAGINKIDVYLLKNNQLSKTLYLGDLRDQKERDILNTCSNVNLIINPKESITVISKIENFNIYNLGWEILETTQFFKIENKKIFLFGLWGG